MSVVQTFKVLKPLKTGGRDYQRGELLPAAESWPFHVQDQRMRTGYIEKVTVSVEEYNEFLGRLNSEALAEYAPEAETPPAPDTTPEGDVLTDSEEGADDTVPVITESDVNDEPEVLEEDAGEDEEVSEEEESGNSDITSKPKKIVRKRRG